MYDILMCFRTILALLYIFIIIYIIVDVVIITKRTYNLVSLSGIVFYVVVCFIVSVSPAYVSIVFVTRNYRFSPI